MEKTFHKLVRDFIPDIIQNNGDVPFIRTLNEDEYKYELLKKLKEEVEEVCSAEEKENIIEELADVYEVLMAIAMVEDSTMEQVVEIANQKRLKRGGFQKRIFLEKTCDKNRD